MFHGCIMSWNPKTFCFIMSFRDAHQQKTIPLKPYPSNAIFFFFFTFYIYSSFTCTKSHILFIINWLYCKLCEFMTCILVTSRITFYIHTLFICTCWCMICVVPFYKILQLILLILFGLHFFFYPWFEQIFSF